MNSIYARIVPSMGSCTTDYLVHLKDTVANSTECVKTYEFLAVARFSECLESPFRSALGLLCAITYPEPNISSCILHLCP